MCSSTTFSAFLADPLLLLRVWEGGMSFHGGLLGVMFAMWWYGRKVGSGFWRLADFVAPLVPLGLGAGRIGNFINGELWGKPTDVAWGMVFRTAPDSLARHPSQLYQFALEGVALFVILWWFSSRQRPTMAVSGLFLVCYGVFRFLVEFVRQPDPQLGYLAFDWLTMGQVLSFPMILAGAALMFIAYRRNARMKAYLDLMQDVVDNGFDQGDRTGVGTRSVFGRQIRFDLQDGFPLVTTKKVHLRSIIYELLWFLQGSTDNNWLKERNVSIWNEWALENGDLGPIYGKQWRSWHCPDGERHRPDQRSD